MAKKRARDSKGHFKKGGGKARRSSGSRTHRRRRGGAHHGAVTLGKLALVGAGLGLTLSESSEHKLDFLVGTEKGKEGLLTKVPGYKSLGGPVVAGVIAAGLTAIGVSRNPWVRAAGYIGVAGAALAVGAQGTKFKLEGEDGMRALPPPVIVPAPTTADADMHDAVSGEDTAGEDTGEDTEGEWDDGVSGSDVGEWGADY